MRYLINDFNNAKTRLQTYADKIVLAMFDFLFHM